MTTPLQLRSLSAEGFRGVTRKLSLDFTLNDKPVSVLFTGDNGIGKSSLMDAIEFALQARIGRRQSLDGLETPAVRSLHGGDTSTSVTLSDMSVVERTVSRDGSGKLDFNKKMHPEFRLYPIALRRADILRFWDTPIEKRQTIFFEYFRDQLPQRESQKPLHEERIAVLKEERLQLKNERRQCAAELAGHLGLDPSSIPLDQSHFRKFATSNIYGGIKPRDRTVAERRGLKLQFDAKLDTLAKKMQSITNRIARIHGDLGLLSNEVVVSGSSAQLRKSVNQAMENISDYVTTSFKKLSPSAAYLSKIELHASKLSALSLSFRVELVNGQTASPRQIFSEANLDLLSFLTYIAIAREASKNSAARMLILDDVFQSVDANIRVTVLQYLLEEFDSWQFLLCIHDRLWREQVKQIMRRSGHDFLEYELIEWTLESGPRIRGGDSSLLASLKNALTDGQPREICADAGVLLESMCQSLSVNLPSSVIRKPGDRYTIGDMWPGILKVLKRTSLSAVAQEVETRLHLRNLLGAHYNEWAIVLSRDEAQAFGKAVQQLLAGVFCNKCSRWIEEVRFSSGPTVEWSCRCRHTRVAKLST